MSELLDNEQLLDRELALEHVQGDEEFLKEIYQIFLEEIPGRRKNFTTAMDNNDIDSIVGYAHSLKGVALTIGALSCHKTAQKLEFAAREKNTEEVTKTYSTLTSILEKLEQQLKNMDLL